MARQVRLAVVVVMDTLTPLRTNLPHQSAALAGEGLTEKLEWPEPLGKVIRAEMVVLIQRHFAEAEAEVQVLLVALLQLVFLETAVQALQTQLLELLDCLQHLLLAAVEIPQLQVLLALVVLRLGATAVLPVLLGLMQL